MVERFGLTVLRYLGPVTTESQWIGDLGHLALADATLGALLIDILGILGYAGHPEAPPSVNTGLTTKAAAKEVQRRLKEQPELFGDTATDWLSNVVAVAESRNQLLHAVALDRCGTCGTATKFTNPRSGSEVDRSEQAVRDLTEHALTLHRDGMLVADQIAEQVNERILARAGLNAKATGQAQGPPQVYPHHVTHQCATCAGNGRGSMTVHVGPAVVVYPREQMKALMEGPNKPPRDDR
jgi:hypothetical protein